MLCKAMPNAATVQQTAQGRHFAKHKSVRQTKYPMADAHAAFITGL
jgi:hypothetical protein